MPSLTIRHVTTYRYRQPVAFGEHRIPVEYGSKIGLVTVAVVRDPQHAIPLHGTFVGFPSDHLGMAVQVSVTSDSLQANCATPQHSTSLQFRQPMSVRGQRKLRERIDIR
jgi:hypothetical protein